MNVRRLGMVRMLFMKFAICDLRSCRLSKTCIRRKIRKIGSTHVPRDRKSQIENRKSQSGRSQFQQADLRRTLISDRKNHCSNSSRDVDLRVLASMKSAGEFSARQQ